MTIVETGSERDRNLSLSDEAIVKLVLQGDRDLYEILIRRHNQRLYRIARSILRDESEAEDVMHEAFMAVLREREHRHRLHSFRAWLYQVARNLCSNRVRSRKRAGRVASEALQIQPESAAPVAEHARTWTE